MQLRFVLALVGGENDGEGWHHHHDDHSGQVDVDHLKESSKRQQKVSGFRQEEWDPKGPKPG
jgi:hypothetical protein